MNKLLILFFLLTTSISASSQKIKDAWIITWSPDQKHYIIGGDDSSLHIFNAHDHKRVRSFHLSTTIKGASWHPFEPLLAIATSSNVQILHYATGKIQVIKNVKGGRGIGWNYNGQLLALADGYGLVQIMNKEGKLLRSIPKYNNNGYLTVDWHPSKNILVTGSDEIILFDTSGKQLKFIQHRKEPTGVLTVKWHPSGEFFASGDYGHDVVPTLLQFWREDGTLLKEMKGSGAEYRNIRWNKEGTLLATASDGLRIWSKEGKLLYTNKTNYLLWGIDWNKKNDRIITISFDGDIDVWNAKAQKIK